MADEEITPEQADRLARLKEFEGQVVGDPFRAHDPVNQPMIRVPVHSLGLEPLRVLASGDDAALPRQAKARDLRTVQFVGENEELPVRRDRRPDYDVSACADVVGVIDELNGLSVRGGSSM